MAVLIPTQNYINEFKGLGSWFCSLDHKENRILYMILWWPSFSGRHFCPFTCYELIAPGADLFTGNTYNQVMTYHGSRDGVHGDHSWYSSNFRKLLCLCILVRRTLFFLVWTWLVGMCLWGGSWLYPHCLVRRLIQDGLLYPYSIKTGTATATMVIAAFIMGMSLHFGGFEFHRNCS